LSGPTGGLPDRLEIETQLSQRPYDKGPAAQFVLEAGMILDHAT
jgi:hypothetical protein